jgi:hypothetical protein
MNPQPPIYVGQLVAVIFGVLFLFYFFKEFFNHSNQNTNQDLFTLGYIEESNNVIVNVKNKIIKEQAKPSFESQQLYIDCIDALHSIGMKKTEAKKLAKEIFSSSSNPPTSIQDFLMIALRKNS